jgi:hypothetical protein
MPRLLRHPGEQDGTPGSPVTPRFVPLATPSSQPGGLDQLADLVTSGLIEFPAGLGAEAQEQLMTAVRQRLRHRILQYLAQQLALDLWREAQSTE